MSTDGITPVSNVQQVQQSTTADDVEATQRAQAIEQAQTVRQQAARQQQTVEQTDSLAQQDPLQIVEERDQQIRHQQSIIQTQQDAAQVLHHSQKRRTQQQQQLQNAQQTRQNQVQAQQQAVQAQYQQNQTAQQAAENVNQQDQDALQTAQTRYQDERARLNAEERLIQQDQQAIRQQQERQQALAQSEQRDANLQAQLDAQDTQELSALQSPRPQMQANTGLPRTDISPAQNVIPEDPADVAAREVVDTDIPATYATEPSPDATEYRDIDTRQLERDFLDHEEENERGVPTTVIADLYAARSNLLREVERIDRILNRLR